MKLNYKKVKDNYRPFWIVASILFFTCILINLFIGFTAGSVFVEIAIIGAILGTYQGIRTRRWPICGQKMTKAFNGTFMPEHHYCEICETYIDTKVESYSS